MKYTLLQPQGITTLKLQSESLTIPLSTEQIRELFATIAQAKGISGESKTTNDIVEFSLTLNDKHEMLNNEGGECVLADYIATFESGEVFVNLGCCFFALEDITNVDENLSLAIIKELLPEAYNAQPLIMRNYAKRCFIKKNDALTLTKGGSK